MAILGLRIIDIGSEIDLYAVGNGGLPADTKIHIPEILHPQFEGER